MPNNISDSNPDFGMFTDTGNLAVQTIAAGVIEIATGLSDNEVWAYAYSHLELLSRADGFSEATDTVCRELLWDCLIEAGAIQDPANTDYWFYVNWLDLGQENYVDLFIKTVDQHDNSAITTA